MLATLEAETGWVRSVLCAVVVVRLGLYINVLCVALDHKLRSKSRVGWHCANKLHSKITTL
jgi:hypothetical protein